MSLTHISLLLSLVFSFSLHVDSTSTTPYLSPTTLFPNYQNMLKSFKIFTYPPPQQPLLFSSPSESLFFYSLLNSSFITHDPEQAHLFFIPFSSHTPTRSLARVINSLRNDFPFWNRTLGADHFYLSCNGLSFNSDRNIVELKKNSIQISCFPTPRGKFIPHKDITLPPLPRAHPQSPIHAPKKYLGYYYYVGGVKESSFVKELIDDPEFIIVKSEPSDVLTYYEESKFCLFDYEAADVTGMSDAVRFGCVPVVITDRPIQDLPLMDVVRWQEIAVFVGGGGGVKELKRVLERVMYEEVSGLCVTAGQHLMWNEEPQPYDSFHMVMYQLWLRRHTIRYARAQVA